MRKGRYGVVVLAGVIALLGPNNGNAENSKIDIHGFVSQGYLLTDENNFLADTKDDGSFQFDEIGLTFNSKLTDELRAGLQFFARDLGDVGNNEPTLDWALLDYHYSDYLGARVGKLRPPVGFFNQSRDIDATRTFVFLPYSVYNDLFRDTFSSIVGAGLYGSARLGPLGSLSYQAQIGSTVSPTDGGVAKYMSGQSIPLEITNIEQGQIEVGQLMWNTHIEGLRFP